MADTHDDYVWDHTGEHLDDSPLLGDQSPHDGSYFYNFSRQDSHPGNHTTSQKLTKRQAEYMLRTFEDGAALIRSQLLTEPERPNVSVEVQPTRCLQCKRALVYFESCSFLLTLLLQIANIIILTLLDHYLKRPKSNPTIAQGEIVMLIIELLNLVLVVYTSIKLGQQLFHRRVNGNFLAQCYLSSILLFTGLYALTFRLNHKSWRFVDEYDGVSPEPLTIVYLFLKMLYLSVSTATLCGSSVITPREWYNYVLMGLQMLLSFVAFASILGQMFSHTITNGPGYHNARKPPPTVRHRRPSVDSQASLLTAGSYGALDSTHVQPIGLNGHHNIGPS